MQATFAKAYICEIAKKTVTLTLFFLLFLVVAAADAARIA